MPKPGVLARSFRKFSLLPHFKGKSRIERLIEPLISLESGYLPIDELFEIKINKDSAFERSLYFRNCESATFELLRRSLKPGMTFCDFGANLGFFSLAAASFVESSGQVYAFEPTPKTFSRLKEGVRHNQFSNIRLFELGLSDQKTKTRIHQFDAENIGRNSIVAPDTQDTQSFEIQLDTWDRLFEQEGLKFPDWVKIDVEGSELNLLKGALKLFEGPKYPSLIIELSHETFERFGYTPADLVDFILKRGPYSMYWLRGQHPIKVDPKKDLPHVKLFGRNHGDNYLFTTE